MFNLTQIVFCCVIRSVNLTPRQQETFDVIVDIVQQGRLPRTNELLERLNYSHPSGIDRALKTLAKTGVILVKGGTRGRERTITLTDKGRGLAHFGVPVLGKIPAGPMLVADDTVTEWIDPGTTLKTQPGDFFLPVQGDSMVGDGILDGDRVLIRPNVIIGNGQIAAVADTQDETTGEHLATLKRVYHEPGEETVRLKASNPKYKDLILPTQRVRIVGAYCGLFRR